MEGISASVNEKELRIMNEEYEMQQGKVTNGNNLSQDVDFFDNSPKETEEMEVIIKANKRRLEETDYEQASNSRNKTSRQIENDPPAALNSGAGSSNLLEDINVVHAQESARIILSKTHSLSGNTKDAVILIKPEIDDPRKLINDPVEIVTAIEVSKFGKLNISDIRTNKRKGILIANVKNCTQSVIDELLNVQYLGKWKVKCYRPNRDIYKAGVISPINTDTDLDKIKQIISEKHKITAVERLKKKTGEREWSPSNSIKVVFEEQVLPSEIVIGHSFYKVRPYVNQPLQCFRCQRLGHTAEGCNSCIKCLVCGGDHVKEVCNAKEECCANCRGNHKANSKLCIIIKNAYEV